MGANLAHVPGQGGAQCTRWRRTGRRAHSASSSSALTKGCSDGPSAFREMDVLSDIASIIAVLQLTGQVIKYLKDIKDAPKECRHCATEAANLHGILINLLYHLNQDQTGDAWFTAVRNLNVENGPLDQYKQALEELRSRVEIQDGVQKVKQRLLWKFSKEEVASILARMERLKSLVNIALEMDHLYVHQY